MRATALATRAFACVLSATSCWATASDARVNLPFDMPAALHLLLVVDQTRPNAASMAHRHAARARPAAHRLLRRLVFEPTIFPPLRMMETA
jgi:hypothetical protein